MARKRRDDKSDKVKSKVLTENIHKIYKYYVHNTESVGSTHTIRSCFKQQSKQRKIKEAINNLTNKQ